MTDACIHSLVMFTCAPIVQYIPKRAGQPAGVCGLGFRPLHPLSFAPLAHERRGDPTACARACRGAPGSRHGASARQEACS